MTIYQNKAITIAVVGDVHDQWETADNDALEGLKVDLVLFVGDFGNESVPVVRKISQLSVPKAVIMGNHDAWYTASGWGRKKCPYDRSKEDWLQDQLDILGDIHVGYSKLDFPQFNLSVVGSRPYSWGGPEWKNKQFLSDRYQVSGFKDSTEKIMSAVQETSEQNVIFLGHNGPAGLGRDPEAICGKDWQPIGGDHGDPDFSQAIAQSYDLGKKIPLVTFGHMHHSLRHTRSRLRTKVVTNAEQTVFLNAACVPRVIEENGQKLRNFSLVSLDNNTVTNIASVWVDAQGAIATEECLYKQPVLSPIY
ncbi:TIGR04168 family protein [Crocosphaera sp.]|uniref:TIGR04168 family protein n=1 Tax=Crocosphaera sp. TaxID=2729996 RepID=UPI002624666B|nr:TIGR04168 family protein [Crocosphaera sp.]MDJ0582179.1 TIGR04168 family protein [Crocosphaera sp.]